MSDEERREQPEDETEEQEHQEDLIHHEVELAHSEGDWRTWLILGIIVAGAVIHSIAIYLLVGRGIAGPNGWNLGYPPTAPNVIWPF